MATIKVNMDNETPWGIANKLAAQWSNQQSAAEAGVRRLKEGDLDGSYEDDMPDKLKYLQAQTDAHTGSALTLQHDQQDFQRSMAEDGYTTRRYGGATGGAATLNPNAARFADGAAAGGVTNPNALAAVLGHAETETGGTFNPKTSHDNKTGFGMLGWRDPPETPGRGRWTDLKRFAAAKNMDPGDAYTQGMFFAAEAQGEIGNEAQHLGQGFLNAGSVDEAAQMLRRSQRAKASMENWPRRLASANRYARMLQGIKPGSVSNSVSQQRLDRQLHIAGMPDSLGNVPDERRVFKTKEGDNAYRYWEVGVDEATRIKIAGMPGMEPNQFEVDPLEPAKPGKVALRAYDKPRKVAVPVPQVAATTVAAAAPQAPAPAPAPVQQAPEQVAVEQQEGPTGKVDDNYNSFGTR